MGPVFGLKYISLSWWGKQRSSPPPWMPTVFPRYWVAIVEHSTGFFHFLQNIIVNIDYILSITAMDAFHLPVTDELVIGDM
jgi:hypothetical protein